MYLQTVVQGEMLVALACGEQQMTCALGISGFVAGHLSVLRRCRLQILPNPNELPPGLHQLGQEPQRHIIIRVISARIFTLAAFLFAYCCVFFGDIWNRTDISVSRPIPAITDISISVYYMLPDMRRYENFFTEHNAEKDSWGKLEFKNAKHA